MASLEHELKYRLPAARLAPALGWLKAHGRPEPRHADNRVVSVYYDTPRLGALQESLGGDWAKSKVRLRWYEPIGGGPASDPFLEVKDRFGRRRRKLRLPLSASDVAGLPLEHPRWRTLLQALPGDAFAARSSLLPVLEVAYRRRRFVDRFGDARISIDSEIGVRATHRGVLISAARRQLDVVLLEVKSATADLPPLLRGLLPMGLRLTSFSKYRAAWEAARGGTASPL